MISASIGSSTDDMAGFSRGVVGLVQHVAGKMYIGGMGIFITDRGVSGALAEMLELLEKGVAVDVMGAVAGESHSDHTVQTIKGCVSQINGARTEGSPFTCSQRVGMYESSQRPSAGGGKLYPMYDGNCRGRL